MYAPKEYYLLSEAEKSTICNGTGPGSWKPFTNIIPLNNLGGIDITECSNIHDYMYYIGGNRQDKMFADSTYKDNLAELINTNEENFVINKLRKSIATMYYFFVVVFGYNFFNYHYN